jgi:hypothetical protein
MNAFNQTDQFIITDNRGNEVFNSGVIAGTTQAVLPRGRYTITIIPTIITGSIDISSVVITQTTQTYKQVVKQRTQGSLFRFRRTKTKYDVVNRIKTLSDGRIQGRERTRTP